MMPAGPTEFEPVNAGFGQEIIEMGESQLDIMFKL